MHLPWTQRIVGDLSVSFAGLLTCHCPANLGPAAIQSAKD